MISWENSEKVLLKLIRKKRRRFLKYCQKNWYDPFFFTGLSTVGYQNEIRIRYSQKPNLGIRIATLGRAIHIACQIHDSTWGIGDSKQKVDFLEKLYKKYRKRIKAEKSVTISYLLRTKLLGELLKRGFESFIPNLEPGYYLYAREWGLVHNYEPFKTIPAAKQYCKRNCPAVGCTIKIKRYGNIHR